MNDETGSRLKMIVGNGEFEIDLSLLIAFLEEWRESKVLQLIVSEFENGGSKALTG